MSRAQVPEPARRRALTGRTLTVRALIGGLAAALLAGLLAPSSADAAPTVRCATAEAFTRVSGGGLYRLADSEVLTGNNTLAETGQVGRGWGSFAWTGAAGDGVVYALTSTGALLWYRYDAVTKTWAANSGTVIGSGFTPGSRVVNISVGANGWIYVVRSSGALVIYQHTGRLTGAPTWANGGGSVIGAGWTANEILAPQGDGVLYRQIGGALFWYRHTDPSKGPVAWTNAGRGTKIGAGWQFYDVLALGGGVLLTTAAPSGQVSLYQHADPAGGGQGWSVVGLKKYLAKQDSFGLIIGANTCA